MNVPDVNRLKLNPFDVTLVVKDGMEFKAHRQVLSESSPFFEKLLSSDMKENKEGVIRLEILNDSQMTEILEFIYTGKVHISTHENAEDLIAVADYLALPNLKSTAGKFLEKNLSPLNCLTSFYLAEQYMCAELIDSTRKFIYSNFAIVAKTEHFINLPSCEVEKWISSDEIVISVEEDIFEIILSWVNHNKSERSVKFSELFRHVRLTCVSRDFLMSDVVTNDLVKGNGDHLGRVTGALRWLDQTTYCDDPRPHSPRKALQTCVIAACRVKDAVLHPVLYLPEKDEVYCLPPPEMAVIEDANVISCRGKLFFVPRDISSSQCYDPDLNRWFPAPWTKQSDSKLQLITGWRHSVLAVKNQIYFIVDSRGKNRKNLTWLSKYDLDTDLLVLSNSWSNEKYGICFVAVERCIYAIGGMEDIFDPFLGTFETVYRECSRFDTQEDKWQDIASLETERCQAFGVGVNEKIFIAGGLSEYFSTLKTCEVYKIETDEWNSIASLTVPRSFGNMVLVDQTLFVVPLKEWPMECYDDEKNEWSVQTNSLVQTRWSFSNACSFRLFSGALRNLKGIHFD